MSVSSLPQLRVTARTLNACAPATQDAVVGLTVAGPFVEGQTIRVRVRRGGSLVGACSVGVELVGMVPGRLLDPALQRVSFGTGTTSAEVAWRTFVVVGDQGTSLVTAQLVDPVQCAIAGGAGSVVFSVLDVDPPADLPVVSVTRASSTPPTIREGETALFTITANALGFPQPATVAWSVGTGTAADLPTSQATTGSLTVGVAQQTADVEIRTAARGGEQGARTLTFSITGVTGGTLGTPVSATCTINDVTAGTAWWSVLALPTLRSRTYRGGTSFWGSATPAFASSLGTIPQLVMDNVFPGANTPDAWEQVAGGPVYANAATTLTSLNDAPNVSPFQGRIRSGSTLSAGVNALINLSSTNADKFFVVPFLCSHPTGPGFLETRSISGTSETKPNMTSFNLIAANGSIGGGKTTDDVFESLGKRWRLQMDALGFAADKLFVRWDKEANRYHGWGQPWDMHDTTKFNTFIEAWKRILTSFRRGYGIGPNGLGSRHVYGWARFASGPKVSPTDDPTAIDQDRIWDAMEISLHPSQALFTGPAKQALTGNETVDGTAKARVKANFDKWMNGTADGGMSYEAVVTYCKAVRIPFVITETDSNKLPDLSWCPDWTNEFLYNKFNIWDADLRANGAAFMAAWYDTDITRTSGLPNDFTESEASIIENAPNLPAWYPGYTAIKPIPDANWNTIKGEYFRRWQIACGDFKVKWGV